MGLQRVLLTCPRPGVLTKCDEVQRWCVCGQRLLTWLPCCDCLWWQAICLESLCGCACRETKLQLVGWKGVGVGGCMMS